MKTDTIAAISTAMSNSGIGIIRISGDEAISLINSIFINKNNKECLSTYGSNTIHYGFIIGEDKNIIDEVMVSVMKSPNSYTTEDTVEINCHGGVFMMKKIMDVVLKTGIRAAQPGEFTKRAFLNGRIDLSEAEAVMDIINSKNEFALKASVNQLKGSISSVIKNLREEILYEIAFIESALDDPEHISLDGYQEKLSEKIETIIEKLKNMIDTADNGKILKEGINTVIVGKPNVGKSSLLNILVGEEKAIVTDIAGTTRDALEEQINLNGIILNIIDTAGIRDTEDVVEKIGVEKSKKHLENADLIIYVVDASTKLDDNDKEIIKLLNGRQAVILLNKSDLETLTTEQDIKSYMNNSDCENIISFSAKEQIGLEKLEKTVKQLFFNGKIAFNDEVYITNIRHKATMQDALSSLELVKQSILNEMPEDFYSIDLMSAYSSLGIIIGEEVGEDLVNEIFSKFCMGK